MSKRACRNRPAATKLPGHYVQDGWTDDGRRHMVFHRTRWDPIPCGHTERASDESCDNCRWRQHPESSFGVGVVGRYLGDKARQELIKEADRRMDLVGVRRT